LTNQEHGSPESGTKCEGDVRFQLWPNRRNQMLVSINRTVSAESFWEQARQCAWVGRNSCSVFCRLSLITRAASVALEAACLPVVRVGDGRERRGVPGKFARTRCAGSREALGNWRGGCDALSYERLLLRPRGPLYSISNEGALITSGVILKNPARAQSRRIFSSRIFWGMRDMSLKQGRRGMEGK